MTRIDNGLPGYPGIVIISNGVENGRDIGVLRAGEDWHSDMCYTAQPPQGTMLYAHEVPMHHSPALGDTCASAAAHDTLPPEMQHRLKGVETVFNFADRKRARPITPAQRQGFSEVVHPMVRPHPITGRKCLYIMRHDGTGLVDAEAEEAQLLIAAPAVHIMRPEFVYRHQWRIGDLLLWDNCTVQHRAMQDDELPLRCWMHRTAFFGA